jgi:hypothetical protein
MTRLDVTYCGHTNKEAFELALKIADCCETEDEFYAEVDRQLACEDPLPISGNCGRCTHCAYRESIYGLSVSEVNF